MRHLLVLALTLGLGACAQAPSETPLANRVSALAAAIVAMSPKVDPGEAHVAAALSYATANRLAIAYEITDPPLLHNAKVNAGTKPRGLCYHWAEDMAAALKAQEFQTLDVTRAIANSQNFILIEHSTAVIVAKGAPMQSGVVVDPWRKGGRLFWSPVQDDSRYVWLPRLAVLKKRGQVRYAHRTAGSKASLPQH